MVVMTSWSAPGSPIRYYQCPFCARTHSSLYGEVFRRGAGARLLDGAARTGGPAQIPTASQEEIRWAQVKATAARWFARLEADEQRNAVPRSRCRPSATRSEGPPEIDASEVIEIACAVPRRR
jgi:hypothetical protein